MTKIVIACDSFKGSCSSADVVYNIALGVKKVYPEAKVEMIPIADGGEGMLDAVLKSVGGVKKYIKVRNPLGEVIESAFLILNGHTAVIEMAAASGLTLIDKERLNPMITTTYGTGELIRAALEEGCREIVIGIGGSATNDGGMGMAQALGVRFLDKDERELKGGGGSLSQLDRIDVSCVDERLKDAKIIVASDVVNPLCGKDGASYVYGSQKGATADMMQILDKNLEHLAKVAAEQLGKDILNKPGSGAAGGLGGGLMLFCNAEIRSGITTILDIIGFDNKVSDADMVITGEGKIDSQSVFGKVPVGVARRVKHIKDIPVFAVVGGIEAGYEAVYGEGIDAVLSIAPGPVTLEEAMENAEQYLQDTAERLMRIIKASGRRD